jgi:hypothetical protein
VGIRVNDEIGYYFQTQNGLHQGESLSLILFNIVVDMLVVIISHAKEEASGWSHPHLFDGGVSIL